MDNILVGSARHLELSGGLRDLEYLMLNFPYSCNYRCSKCCNYERGAAKSASLSLSETTQLMQEAKDLGIRILVIAGEGEPFLDNRIKNMIEIADESGLIPYVFTNGSLLKEELPQFLKERNASLVINMDSLGKNMYEKINGIAGSFDEFHRNLAGVREIFEDTYSCIGGYGLRRIAINTVVSHHNEKELHEIKEFCGNDFVFVCNSPMNVGRAHDNPYFKDIEIDMKTTPLGTTSDEIWCAYMRNGISVGAGGDILTCAYSLESLAHWAM